MERLSIEHMLLSLFVPSKYVVNNNNFLFAGGKAADRLECGSAYVELLQAVLPEADLD